MRMRTFSPSPVPFPNSLGLMSTVLTKLFDFLVPIGMFSSEVLNQ